MRAPGYSAVGLVNPKNSVNVGAVLRAAHAFDAKMVALQGIRYSKALTDISRAHRVLPLIHGEVLDLVPYDCVPIAVELVEGAVDLRDYEHPRSAFYIFGPEDGNVPKRILKKCRDVIQIPTTICLNLAATVNVVLYDRLCKRGKV